MAVSNVAIKPIDTPRRGIKRHQMTYEEYVDWADEDTHTEWVNGEVFEFMPPRDIHQATLGFFYQLLTLFVDMDNLGKVRVAPFEMRLAEQNSYREPDILFVSQMNLAKLTEKRLDGPADLIVEIVSASTVRNDREVKLKAYQAAGVSEYWIIDPRPNKQRADLYHLDKSGVYQLVATEEDTRLESRLLPGFWVAPDWLWQADSLSPLSTFFEMRGLTAEQIVQIQQMLNPKSLE